MTKMYDSINVAAIPADATELLAYTDGMYANVGAMRARFPNARIHTISAVGSVVAEWIDVENGCVWPPNRAVDLWRSWRTQGCKGFYCSISLQPTIRALLNPGENPEWFDANYTNVDHVDPGDVATQYEDVGPYDISETTPAFDPTPTPTQEDDMIAEIWHDNTNQYVVFANGTKIKVPDPASGSALETNPAFTYRQVPTELLNAIPGN